MPTGKVKWYDTDKGFGFLTRDDGGDVYVRRDALPEGVPSLKPGSRVEFGIVEGRKGEQALTVKLLDPLPSVAHNTRKSADDMAIIVEDLIKLLDGVGTSCVAAATPTARWPRRPPPSCAPSQATSTPDPPRSP